MSVSVTAAPINFSCSSISQVIDFICGHLLQDRDHAFYGSVSDAVNGWFAAQRRVLCYLRYSLQHQHTNKQQKRRICFIQADIAMQMQSRGGGTEQHQQTPPGWDWSQVKQILYEVLPIFAQEMAEPQLHERLMQLHPKIADSHDKWLLLADSGSSESDGDSLEAYRCGQLRRWLHDFLFARIRAWPLLSDVIYFMQLNDQEELRQVLFTQLSRQDMELVVDCLQEVSLNRLIDLHESGVEQPISPAAQSLLNAVLVSAFPLTCYDTTPDSPAEDFHTSVIKHYFPGVVLQIRRRIRAHIAKYCSALLPQQQQQDTAEKTIIIQATSANDHKLLAERLAGCSRLLVCNAERCDVVMFVAVKELPRGNWSLEQRPGIGVSFGSVSRLVACLSSSIELVGHSSARLLFL